MSSLSASYRELSTSQSFQKRFSIAWRMVVALLLIFFAIFPVLWLVSASFGQWHDAAGCETAHLLDEARYRYLRLVFDGDRLVGANSIGHTEHLGVLRGLIQGRVRLGEWKARLLANPTLLSEAYLARGLAAA